MTVLEEIPIGPERSVYWDAGFTAVAYLDQRLLPHAETVLKANSVSALIAAIQSLAIRGAPAIGIAGAYGVALIRRTIDDIAEQTREIARLREARPTAIHLAWAIDRVAQAPDPLAEAERLHREQIAVDRAIATHAQGCIPVGARILTHCHTGGIATAGEGTALGAIIAGYRSGRVAHVYVDETRPLLQGARLTLWELGRHGVPATLIVEGAAASAMARGLIDLVLVGADRIAQNRDTANKIGTYGLAVAAHYHRIPFYVAAPEITFDPMLHHGSEIHIEERAQDEVLTFAGRRVAASGRAANPAFDVTPSALITGIITEHGMR
jgi:methylthioribose-1-phosphate isomerase